MEVIGATIMIARIAPAGLIPAEHTSPKVRRPVTLPNEAALRRALEAAGVEFIDENGGGPGLRLRKRPRAKPAKS